MEILQNCFLQFYLNMVMIFRKIVSDLIPIPIKHA